MSGLFTFDRLEDGVVHVTVPKAMHQQSPTERLAISWALTELDPPDWNGMVIMHFSDGNVGSIIHEVCDG